jgi:hypothetical protein
MALKFNVGDKVRIKEGSNWGEMEGYTGTIVLAQDLPVFPYNLTMDDLPTEVAKQCPRENWFVDEDEIELVEV